MSGIRLHKHEVTMRPLRDRQGATQTIVVETRTAAQATREATLRFPSMKVISVTRLAQVATLLPTTRDEQPGQREIADPREAERSSAMPLRRVDRG